jgi:hypothetical protein
VESSNNILRGHSQAPDAREAALEFHAAVFQPDLALVMFFCSSEYDLDELASELSRLFAGVQVVGCTTAGEIGPAGCLDHSIAGASFSARSFTVANGLLSNLGEFAIESAHSLEQDLLQQLENLRTDIEPSNTFALLLIDGLSMREEIVTAALQNALGEIPLVGGSAGDGLEFGHTYVYANGRFHEDSAVVILVSTPLAFTLFQTQHFVPVGNRVVVTAADAEQRIVQEIDGWPAAEYYAELVGSQEDSLSPEGFADDPMVVVIDGTNYVRSIQRANPDGTLKFYCAIDEGMVLRTARGGDLVANLEQAFTDIRTTIGQPQLVIAFDCILRKLEIGRVECGESVESVFKKNNVVGFNSYGEQYRGVHINQTLTGIAIGELVS